MFRQISVVILDDNGKRVSVRVTARTAIEAINTFRSRATGHYFDHFRCSHGKIDLVTA